MGLAAAAAMARLSLQGAERKKKIFTLTSAFEMLPMTLY